ncbi:MAG: hypothetical protein IJM62_02975 [Lachnospiraceae bacterium]|nr:hypothetical protein [Lachnospiraceae bacterium]
MNWLNGFELLCYILSAALIADIIRKKNMTEAKLFVSGAIAGYALELLAVRVTDIYYYNPGFWLNIGRSPYQFPVFGGLMWGGLTVCALRLASRLGFSRVMTALVTGFLIVSMDMLLDVAAIRLDGGFWTWAGRPITEEITHHMFMSVIWVNFLGYMFETPMITWLALRDRQRGDRRPFMMHAAAAVFNAAGGICFVGGASLLSLWLDSITDEWFSFIAFLLIWGFVLVRIMMQLIAGRPSISSSGDRDMLAMVFFAAMYIYCFAGLFSLGIYPKHIWYLTAGILLFAGTVMLGIIRVSGTFAGRRGYR